MKNIKGFFFILAILCLSNTLFTQANYKVNKKIYKAKTKNDRYSTTQYASKYTALAERKVVTSHKYVWVLSANGKKGTWSRPVANEIKNRQKATSSFSYEPSFDHMRPYKSGKSSYVEAPKPAKSIVLNRIKEYKDGLEKKVIKNFTIGKKEDLNKNKARNYSYSANGTQTNVYYTKNINLGILLFLPDVDHIVVTDTLFVPVAAPRKSTFTSLQTKNRNYIRIIANCIVYESPIQLLSSNSSKTDYVFSANKVIFKSNYKNLKKSDFNPPPPFYRTDTNTKAYKDYLGEKERILLNRLFVYSMEQVLTKLNTTSNKWEKDNLLAEFQTYRINRVSATLLSKDKRTKNLFDKLCNDFHSQYGNKKIEEPRDEGNLKVLVAGKVSNLPNTPFKYYTLPTKASLLPANNQNTGKPTALGFVSYNPTGEVALELKMEVALSYNQQELRKVSQILKKENLVLTEKFPENLASIEEQPLKINRQTVGKIIPIGNQNVRFEIQLPDNGLSLLNLFLKPINFKMDYTINGLQEVYSQTILLEIAPLLLESLDPDQVLESFSVIENTTLTDGIKISSKLDPLLENEGTLNYVEVSLEFIFQNKKVFRGPYRFSSYATLGSEITIPFLKYADEYSVKITGQALYENGKRTIDFESTDEIIILDESIFQ